MTATVAGVSAAASVSAAVRIAAARRAIAARSGPRAWPALFAASPVLTECVVSAGSASIGAAELGGASDQRDENRRNFRAQTAVRSSKHRTSPLDNAGAPADAAVRSAHRESIPSFGDIDPLADPGAENRYNRRQFVAPLAPLVSSFQRSSHVAAGRDRPAQSRRFADSRS
jgi:hypothetical protein